MVVTALQATSYKHNNAMQCLHKRTQNTRTKDAAPRLPARIVFVHAGHSQFMSPACLSAVSRLSRARLYYTQYRLVHTQHAHSKRFFDLFEYIYSIFLFSNKNVLALFNSFAM
jgi:hypothetical protein